MSIEIVPTLLIIILIFYISYQLYLYSEKIKKIENKTIKESKKQVTNFKVNNTSSDESYHIVRDLCSYLKSRAPTTKDDFKSFNQKELILRKSDIPDVYFLYEDEDKPQIGIAHIPNLKISQEINKNHKKITVKDIQLEVSKYYNLQFHELCSKNRSRYISKPRQIAMFLSKQLTDSSYPEIGKLFGGKDHATVIHGVNKIKVLSENDRKVKQDLDNIILSLKVD